MIRRDVGKRLVVNALAVRFQAGVVALAFAVTLATLHATAGAANDVFTVANYPVEARAKNAVTAKEQALSDGQQAALRSLLRRIVPVTSYPRLKTMPPLKAADIVDGVAVRAERNSTTDYIATLDFSFQPAAVRDALNRNGIPFVDSQAPVTIVVPIFSAKAGAVLESGSGTWFDAWNGLDLTHTVSPLKLERLKPAITPEAVRALAGGARGGDRIFAGEYKTDRLVVAFAEPDAAGKALIVTLAGADAAGAFNLKKSYRISGGDTGYSAELAAVVGLGILEGRWKAARAGAGGGVDVTNGAGVQIVAEFTTLSEWNEIRAKILDTEGAFDVTIGSVSARSAEVSLRHPGGASGLTQAFASHGLTMDNAAGSWRVHSTF